jgi:hypothetical protein
MRRPDWVSRLRDVVWTAVVATAAGAMSVAAAAAGASTELVMSLGLYGIILAILTPKQ